MRITQELLQGKGACQQQVDRFAVDFPDGTEVTAEVCRAHPGYDYDWAAKNLLTPEKLAEYHAAKAPLLAAYVAAEAPLWAEFEAARAETFGRIWEDL